MAEAETAVKAEPERSCIVTREAKPKEALIRFVVSPQGVLVADLHHKLPGRGIYVTNSRVLIAEAVAKRLFSRAAGQEVELPFDFLNRLEEQMALTVKNALSLARKAGQVIAGFEKIEYALNEGRVVAVLHSPSAGEDGVKKLRRQGVPTFNQLPREWLDEVTAKENAVHVAVTVGPAAPFFIETASRFALFLE